MDDKWRRKVDALILLAKDQKGKPEGDVAQAKLQAILDKYPEASARYVPFRDFIFTTQDFVRAKHWGVDMSGLWQGRDLQDAIVNMVKDLARRTMQEEDSFMAGASPIQEQMYEFMANAGVEGDPCRTCDGPCPGSCEESKNWPQDEEPRRG